MGLETLIGLGGSHSDDVRGVVSEALKAWQPELITLEAPVGEVVITRRIQIPLLKPLLFSLHQAPQTPGYKKLISLASLRSRERRYSIDGELLTRLVMDDAPNAALEFALTTGTPVYFIDNPFGDGKTIAGFHKGRGGTSGNVYYNILRVPVSREEFLQKRTDRGFDRRNKFMASAILFLTERYGVHKLAHAGGMGHFRRDYISPTARVPDLSSTTIQDLVKPEHFQLYGTSGIVKVVG